MLRQFVAGFIKTATSLYRYASCRPRMEMPAGCREGIGDAAGVAAGDAGRPASHLITADRHNRGDDGRETEEDEVAGIGLVDGAGKPYFGETELDDSRQFSFGEAGRRPNPGSFGDERFMVWDFLKELRLWAELRFGEELRLSEDKRLG